VEEKSWLEAEDRWRLSSGGTIAVRRDGLDRKNPGKCPLVFEFSDGSQSKFGGAYPRKGILRNVTQKTYSVIEASGIAFEPQIPDGLKPFFLAEGSEIPLIQWSVVVAAESWILWLKQEYLVPRNVDAWLLEWLNLDSRPKFSEWVKTKQQEESGPRGSVRRKSSSENKPSVLGRQKPRILGD